ncbi:MAG: PAS domain-containing protein [Desulfobacterales bacterium]|nr:PAS domain-containing protein [Desulfobacterales bacterium]
MPQFVYVRENTDKGIKWKTIDLSTQSLDDISSLINSYYVNQIELEKQNKELKTNNDKLNGLFLNYSYLYENAPFGCFTLDMNGLIVGVNSTVLKLLSIEKDKIINKPLQIFIANDDIVVFYMLRSKAISSNTTQVGEIKFKKKDGLLPVQINCMRIDDSKDNLKKIMVTVFDFTEVMKARVAISSRYEFEKIIATLSRKLIASPFENIDEVINASLQNIGIFSGVDRVYISMFSNNMEILTITHEWCAKDISPLMPHVNKISVNKFFPFLEKIKRLETIQIPNILNMPLEEKLNLGIFHIDDLKSFVITPLIYSKNIVGVIGCDSKAARKNWSQDLINLIKISGDIFTSGIMRNKEQGKEHIEEIEEILITDFEEVGIPEDNWKFEKKTNIDAESIELLPKAFVKKDNTVIISCSQCMRQKIITTNEINGLGNILYIMCPCNYSFDIKLEYRRSYRKTINLDGVFIRLPPENVKIIASTEEDWGRIRIENISIKGIGFTTPQPNMLMTGERCKVKFTLNDELRSVIDVRAVVRGVRDNYIGCEFIEGDKYSKILGFYLK